ncbi:MAG: GEVED domain-containing protein, partial [Bacteroidales bacterium]
MIKTMWKLLPLTLLISIFLTLSVQCRGAALLNFSWRSCSNMPGATVANTFSYTIQTANPLQILNARIINSANPVNCSAIESPFNDSYVDVTIVTPSANFEVSLISGTGFSSSSISVPYTYSALTSTPVYDRYKPTAIVAYSSNISNSGGMASIQNVSVSGSSKLSYCTAGTSTMTYMGIRHVVFNTINKTTANLNPGYTDFTALNTTVTAGNIYRITLTGWEFPQNYKAWFDWNQDGDFTDEGESFTIGQSISGTASVASDILIPANALKGNVRMRVRSEYLDASVPVPPACGVVEYGECEDYTLSVSAAVPIVWVGSASTDWNTAGNWSTNVVPTASDNLTIPDVANTPVINHDPGSFAACNNMNIEAGATLTIAAGKALTVNGTLTNNAGVTGLVILSTVAGTGSLLHNTAFVPATINSYITGNTSLLSGVNTFNLVSVPLSPASISTQNLFSGSYLQEFDVAANSWQGVSTPTSNFIGQSRGYMIYTPETAHIYQFAGTMNAGPFSPTVTFAGDGNNLIPNPYPSAIDWNSRGWTKTNIANSVYTWPSGGNNYSTYVDGQTTNGGSNIIPAGQAFIVKATASPTFAMTDAVRVHESHSFFKSHETPADLLRIKATSNQMTDETVIRFKVMATSN